MYNCFSVLPIRFLGFGSIFSIILSLAPACCLVSDKHKLIFVGKKNETYKLVHPTASFSSLAEAKGISMFLNFKIKRIIVIPIFLFNYYWK